MSETEGKASLTCLLAIAEAEASKLEAENDELRMDVDLMNCRLRACGEERDDLRAENAKLRELVANMMPSDSEGQALDIADTVHMLRSEHDGDHEWDDVVVELAWTKWGGDRWVVRGSKGEAWACECTKTGYDEDAYEASDDVEPFDKPTLLEVENAKLRELCKLAFTCIEQGEDEYGTDWSCVGCEFCDKCDGLIQARATAQELGIEV